MGVLIGRWWRTPVAGRSPLAGAAVVALVVLSCHSLVEDAFYASRALLLLFVPLAFVAEGEPFRWPALPVSRTSVWVAGAALLLGALLLFWRPLSAVWLANRAAIAQSRAELGVYRWPDWPIQDAVRREIDLSAVVADYERALSRNPDLVSANRRLGQIALSLGQYERARDLLAMAYARRPDATTRQLYGEALLVTGDQAGGAALWREVRNTEGQLAIRRFWYRYLDDEQSAIRLHEAIP
jgi:tetratricopeptide (TPR) repeat protein